MNKQLSLFDLLEEAEESPLLANLGEILDHLENYLTQKSIESQLVQSAEIITRLASVLKSRADLLLRDWSDRYSKNGPNVDSDFFIGLVRHHQELNLEHLVESWESEQLTYKRRREGSVVVEVEKKKILKMLELIESERSIFELAHDETISSWTAVILSYLRNNSFQSTDLLKLAKVLNFSKVQVFLGLLHAADFCQFDVSDDFYADSFKVFYDPVEI